MKLNRNKNKDEKYINELYSLISNIKSPHECKLLLSDLCTPTEIIALAERWQIAKQLEQKVTHRDIAFNLSVSIATVSRVAKFLHSGFNGYKLFLDRTSKR